MNKYKYEQNIKHTQKIIMNVAIATEKFSIEATSTLANNEQKQRWKEKNSLSFCHVIIIYKNKRFET